MSLHYFSDRNARSQKMRRHNDEQFYVLKPFLNDAIPPRASARPHSSMRKRMDTPLPVYDIADIDTVPPVATADISLQDTIEQKTYRQPSDEDVSSIYTQYIAGTKKSLKSYWDAREPILLNPLENIRWWLLYPGRLEFLLWAGGTLLLLTITILLALITVMSLYAFH
jgi:hypothetical protein